MPSFCFNQIGHNQSFHRNEFDSTNMLFLMLPNKTCFYSSDLMKFEVNGTWFTFTVFEFNLILQLNSKSIQLHLNANQVVSNFIQYFCSNET